MRMPVFSCSSPRAPLPEAFLMAAHLCTEILPMVRGRGGNAITAHLPLKIREVSRNLFR